MLLSEEQARERWCPQARIARRETTDPRSVKPMKLVAGCNRDALGGTPIPASCRCIASDCMSWRWAGWVTPGGTIGPVPFPEDRLGDRLGFCGLAGRPDPYPEPETA